jgi:hypothetical protein
MSAEAPYSKFKKQNFIIGIVLLLVFGAYCMYDGYFNDKFKEKHTTIEGKPDGTLVFNQKAPFFCLAGAVALAVWFGAAKNKKIVAESDGIVINGKEKIAYDSVEKIDRTYFETKDYFIITYKDESGKEAERRLSGRDYDNLDAILNELVAKIS